VSIAPDSRSRGSRLWAIGDSVKVKICRVDSLEIAYDAVQVGVDALGYHIMRAESALESAQKIKDIVDWLPSDVSNVMVSRLTDLELTALVVKATGFDSIQLQIDCKPEEIARLKQLCRGHGCRVRIIKTIWMGRHPTAGDVDGKHSDDIDAFLLDSGGGERGGTGTAPDWSLCRRLRDAAARPVFLAGGLNPQNVAQAISIVRPFGVDVQSGVEHILHKEGREKRIKSPAKIGAFVAAAKGTSE
jgi:phosphoribosylanthranilate isomerase